MNKGFSVRTIVAIGIGSAVFVILGRFAVIPTGIPNTNLELTHPFLALMGMVFGPIAGFLVGFIGHTLKDFTTYGSAWWSWIVCSGFMGIIYGLIGKRIDLSKGVFRTREMVLFNVFQALGNGIVWGLIAPTLDVIVYSEPASKVYVQGITSVIANILITGVAGTILLKAYASTQTQKGSLRKD